MESMRVTKSSHERVLPASPSAGGTVELSLLDQITPRIYVSILFFFPAPSPPDAFLFLKASLAETLTLFYPCAGRFRERSGSSNGDLEIVCNDEGAVLYEAWVDCMYDDFLPNFDPHPDFVHLAPLQKSYPGIPAGDLHHISEKLPLLAQITHFKCGRACIAISRHHTVCDGSSMAHLLTAWAALCKMKVNVEIAKPLQPLSAELHFDRSLLKPNLPPSPTCDHPEFQTHPPIPRGLRRAPCRNKIFSFTPSYIDSIRATANAARGPTPAHTRFEALAAHLWRGITLARGQAPHQEIRLGMSVDGRKRFKPPLPEGYFGNVVFSGYIASTAREISEKPLSFAADLVKDAIVKVSDARMRSTLDWIALQESPTSVYSSCLRPSMDAVITSWTTFPLYKLDFGWGKPSFVRIPSFLNDGFITLLPSPLGKGHVDALVGLKDEHMVKLEVHLQDVLKASCVHPASMA